MTAPTTPLSDLTEAAVLQALATVRDPELDEPITELDFVARVETDGEAVRVALRLPTFYCAPNFSWLMVADAKEALVAAGFADAQVSLDDHYASDEINEGMQRGDGFATVFAGETEGDDLETLRAIFRRKAYLSRQGHLCSALAKAGRAPEDLALMRLGDLPDLPETAAYLERRAELGLDTGPQAALLVDAAGRRVAPERVGGHLRLIRTVGVSIEGNSAFCRGMLKTRYGRIQS